MTVTEKTGQRFVGGFPGKEMSEEFTHLVKEYKVSNAILFQHNVENPAQLCRLCASIPELVCRETGHGALGKLKIPMAAAALRNVPYDAPVHAAALAAWDYAPDTLEALTPILAGKMLTEGRLSIAWEERL